MKKRIALYGKGGIGKTTVAVNTALCMARRGYRVLLEDAIQSRIRHVF